MTFMHMTTLADRIDRLNAAIGRGAAWLAIAVVLLQFALVVARYLFGLGSVWLSETVVYAHATLFMLAAAWTLQAGGHTKLGELRPATRQAYLRLAALAADDFGRPGPRPRTLPAVGAAARINGHHPIDPTPASTRPSQDGADV